MPVHSSGQSAGPFPVADVLWPLVACHLPLLSPLDLCGAGGRKPGTPSSQHGCQTCLLSVLAPGSPVLKGPAEWGFHQLLRGGNKFQGRMSAARCPHLHRPGRVLERLGARFQRHLDIISHSTVWPVGLGGAGGRGQKLAGRWS